VSENDLGVAKETSELVPEEVVESILREHLRDTAAILTDLSVQPFKNDGGSGNHTLTNARIAWAAEGDDSPGSAEWIIKCWEPGGLSANQLGQTLPAEALAWQHGLINPRSFPAGIATPFVGARVDADGTRAWIAMTDVAAELREYSFGNPLHPEEALRRVRIVLDGLARFHAWWEQPQQQEKLAECTWLLPWETKVWGSAAMLALALGDRPPMGPIRPDPVTEDLRIKVHAFLDWLPPSDRHLWEDLMCDRRKLVSALGGLPRTLLHGDLGPRNIGLRWPQERAALSPPELVLIDWEWAGVGPAALDLAPVLWKIPLICDPSYGFPEACWSHELPDYYFARYRSAGGSEDDLNAFRRACDLSQVASWVHAMLPSIGRLVRTQQGLDPGPRLVGVAEELRVARLRSALVWCEQTTERVTESVRRWLA
jgi:hypothetical protein